VVMRYYVSIETNIVGFELYKALWEKYGVIGVMASSMTDGIEKAIVIEKSKVDELYFIDIVADDVIFLPQLKVLSEETTAPILIATTKFSNDEREKVLNIGADFYGEYCETTEQNINAVISAINCIDRRAKKPKPPSNLIIYRGIMLAPAFRHIVFKGNENIDMTRQEFDLLYLLMLNRGTVLSYKQIYRRVWGNEYEDAGRNLLWNAVNRVREKLGASADGYEYIETVREYGYRFPIALNR